jgi:hypothetical protein
MGYVAQQRLRWGDGFIEVGEPVPSGAPRNYQLMLASGEIVFAEDDGSPRPHPDERPHAGSAAREHPVRATRSRKKN